MKRWIPWLVAALVVVLVAAGIWRAVAARGAQQRALAQATAQRAEVVLELSAAELLTVQRRTLAITVPVSGSVRAVQSAVVKARVAGEISGLAVREGDTVRQGQELARIDPTESRARLRQAEQQADAARTQVDIARRQHDNNRALVDQGFISSTALSTSKASLEGAESTWRAAQAAAEVARKSMDDTVLRSPIAGQVAQRAVQNGERVGVDARVLEVVDLSRLELEALLAPADSVGVRVGQQADLRIEGRAEPLVATVARINPSAQAGSRTVPVYLALPADAGLRQGLFVQGTLATGEVSAPAVPLESVRNDKAQPYVQVVEDGRVAHRAVRPGVRALAGGQAWVAVDGLAEGTRVLAGTVGVLREGTAVRLPGAAPAQAVAAPAPRASE